MPLYTNVLKSIEREEEEPGANLKRVKEIGLGALNFVGIDPNSDTLLQDVSMEIVEMASHAKSGQAALVTYPVSQAIQNSPIVRRGLQQLDEAVEPIKTFLKKDHFQPIYEAVGVQPRGVLQQGVDDVLTTNKPLQARGISPEVKASPEYQDMFSRAEAYGKPKIKAGQKTPMKGFEERFIDPTTKKEYRFGAEKSSKTGITTIKPIELGGRKQRYKRRYNARKLDEDTLLYQLGGDKNLLKQYKTTNRSIYRNLELEINKINKAGLAKHGDKWIDLQVEHIFDVQHFWKMSDEVPRFAGKGADEAANLTIIDKFRNAQSGQAATKLSGTDALVKNTDKFVDYERVTREFVDFDMFNTVKNMKTKDWKELTQLVIKHPEMNVHEILINYF